MAAFPPAGCILLIGAIQRELQPAIQRLGLARSGAAFQGAVRGRAVAAVFTGMGRDRCQAGFRHAIAAYQPECVLHAGFAGGLDPGMAAGDVIEATEIVHESGSLWRIRSDGRVTNEAPVKLDDTEQDSPTPPTNRLLTADRLIHTMSEKQALFDRWHARAVDMETCHIARVAVELGLRLRSIRAISDPAGMALPPEAVNWVDEAGSPRVLAAAGYVACRPWRLPMLLGLQRNAAKAANALADAIEAAILSEAR